MRRAAPALIEDVATVIAKYMPLSDLLRLARTSNANYDACTSNRVILPFVHDLGRRLGPGSDRDKLFALDAKVGCYEIDYLTIYRKMLDMYIWPCTSKAVQVGSIFVKLPTNKYYIVVRVQRGRPGGHILYVVPDPPTLDRGWAAVPKNSQDRIWLRHEKQGVIWRYVDAEGSTYQQHR